ncbi:All-trans-zeta-carotene desaturase [Roseivivax jejudonensis]|uniref:Pyridine nucleotide-disulfide oxidoreductase domain-containing protein 2 n=1 Tax=Roseivivax jejudonensis TaxID=1529041 RepID=A0A1X6ZWA8_9RHOB|nr:NAD(P)/FAD-dependent oxidoreductase [Roseivivax jejudonensis]SLN63258.1 All-trans-zeta-carotene desaturase [Roseivivax jejudonensis]
MADAVVIGAGHNGLAAAAALAAKGWSVEVFEQADVPGGAVKTREVTLPGFRHDTGAMNLSLFAGSPFAQAHGAALARHGMDFAPAADCFATAFPDGRWLGVSTDLAVTAARIGGQSARDAATWRRLVAEFGQDAPHIFAVLGAPMTLRSLGRTALSVARQRGIGHVRSLARLMLQSPRAFLDETFESERVKAMCAAWGMHLDFAPDQSGGAVFPYLEAMANQSFGMVIGRGGADTIVRAMVGMIEAAGGSVTCNAPVAEVLTAGGRATGVWLAEGRRVKAEKAVIANVAPSGLARLLPRGSGSARFDDGLARFRHAPGTMMLHLAMDDLPDWAAGAELRRFAYVHLAPSLHRMAATYAEAQAGLLPAEPVIVVGQPTVVDPTRAPEGKHILWVQVRMVPGTIRGDAANEIAARDWTTARDAYAERVLDIMERYAPGLRARILARHVESPEDLEADNPNLVGGDQICGSHHPAQNFLFRPVPGFSDGATPIKRLWMVGAATWPGAGTGAGSGTLLAKRLAG